MEDYGNNSRKRRRGEEGEQDEHRVSQRRPDPPSSGASYTDHCPEQPSSGGARGVGETPQYSRHSIRGRPRQLISSMNASAAGIGDPLAGMFPAAEYQPRQQQQQQQPFLGRGGGIPPHLLAAAGLSSAGGAGANLNLPLLQYLAASQSIPSYGGLPAHIQASALLQGTPYHSTSSLLAQQLQATSQVARNQTASVENATMCAHRRAGGGPGNRALTGRKPVPLYVPTDDESISAYQCLARKQIELFEATQQDIDAGAQGRNRPITIGQVGIRCRYCADLPHRQKTRGSTYYPSQLKGLYQAAQNIANSHIAKDCHAVDQEIRDKLLRLQTKKSAPGGGKKYWSDAAKKLGVYEDDNNGLRFRPETNPN